MEEAYMYITKWLKPIWKSYILCGFNYMASWKRQIYGDNKKIGGCQRLWGRRERRKRWSTEDFWKLLCRILRQWIHVFTHLSKPTECTTERLNPNVNCGLWVVMMSWDRFINGNKWHKSGVRCKLRDSLCAGMGVEKRYVGILYFLLSVAINL